MRLREALARALGAVLAAGLAVSVLVVLWQIASRHVFGRPSGVTDELVRYLLVWIGLLGAAYATMTQRHLAIDLFPRWLEHRGDDRRRALLDLLVATMVGLFAVLVPIVGGASLVRLSIELGQRSAALGLPLGWVYAALPTAGALILVDSVLTAVDALGRLREQMRGASS